MAALPPVSSPTSAEQGEVGWGQSEPVLLGLLLLPAIFTELPFFFLELDQNKISNEDIAIIIK